MPTARLQALLLARYWPLALNKLSHPGWEPTAYGAAVGQGILNEVYWPTAGEPQIRDMGFIVAGDGWWHEVKAIATYQMQIPGPAVLLASVIHPGPAQQPYQLTLQVIPGPGRDVVLVSCTLDGVPDAKLYVFLASHQQQQHPAVPFITSVRLKGESC